MTDLLMGCKYKVNLNYIGKDKYRIWDNYEGKIIFIDEKIVVFDTGLYKTCQMIKDYTKLWRAKKI